MARLRKQSQTAHPLQFLLVLASDHLSAATGLTPTVTISKNGGAFASPSGAVTEIGNGFYQVAGNATDAGSLGPLILHATATGTDPSDVEFQVVAFDPDAAYVTAGTGSGQINPSGGKVPATLAAADVSGNVAADLQTIKTQTVTAASGVTFPASIGTSTLTGTAQTGDAYAYLGTNLGAAGAAATALAPASTALSAANWTTARAGKLDNLDAAVSTRGTSTYAGTDTAGTTTLLARLPAALSFTGSNVNANTQATASALTFNLTGNVTGGLSGAVGSVTGSVGSVSGVTFPANFGSLSLTNGQTVGTSTYAGADTTGTTTLLSRLTTGRAGNLDNLDVAVGTRAAPGAAMALTAAAYQTVAREIYGTSGAVWFVSTTGSDTAGDGLTWATAYATPIKAASVASAGDLILLGGGTFALGNAVCTVPDGVSMRGAGKHATTITSTAVLTSLGCIVKPGTGSVLSDFGIVGLNTDGSYQATIGFNVGAGTPQAFATNWTCRSLYWSADADGIYLNHPSTTPPQFRAVFESCDGATKYDCYQQLANGPWDSVVDLRGCNLSAVGPSATGPIPAPARALTSNSGTVRVFGGTLYATGSTTRNAGVETEGTSSSLYPTIELFGTVIQTSGTAAVDLKCDTYSTVLVSGAAYSTAKTSGTITLAPVPINAPGQVAAGAVADLTTARLGKLDSLTFTSAGKVDATAAGYSTGQDPATLVWGAALPGSFASGSAGNILAGVSASGVAAAVLDVAAGSHNTANTIGAKINAAGGAADPLANPVPGSYATGSAGAALGAIPRIQQQTSGLTNSINVAILGGYANGSLLLVAGDSYTPACGKSITINRPTGAAWPADLTAWTVTLTAAAKPDTVIGTGQVGTLTTTLAVSDPAGVQDLLINALAATTTAELAPRPNGWTFKIVATHGSDVNTLLSGNLSVIALVTG